MRATPTLLLLSLTSLATAAQQAPWGPPSTAAQQIRQTAAADVTPESSKVKTAAGESAAEVPKLSPIAQLPEAVPSEFSDFRQSTMVAPYQERAGQLLDDDVDAMQGVKDFPMHYQPWWSQEMRQQQRERYRPLEISLEQVILSALSHSPRVRALRIDPTIRRKSVEIEEAGFDWLSFAEMKWDDLSDPVGNTLTTGGSPRFRDHNWSLEAGLRRRTRSGAELEISKQVGWQDNNSDFFVPAPQGTSRLAVSFTQPLLRQRGTFYNESRIVLARIDAELSDSETLVKLQDHLVDVSQAYWELFRARASLLQKRKLLHRASEVLQRLEGRREVDVLERQILRARAAVASRRSEIARAAASVRNAESRLRLLVNDPALVSGTPLELLPADVPLCDKVEYSTPDTVSVGLLTRPDIAQAIREIRAQCVRLGVTKAEMLPKLDLVLSSYLAGLEGRGDIFESTRNWFQEGEPGYSIGFNFEYPLGNRAARAQYEQQQFRLRKAMHDFRNTVETGITEIELAVREARTSHAEMLSRYQAMRAAESEAIYLGERWRQLPGDDRTTAELLEDLLDAQGRVAIEEAAFETARMYYMLALVDIKRSTGTLLASEQGGSLLRQHGQLTAPVPAPADAPPPADPGTETTMRATSVPDGITVVPAPPSDDMPMTSGAQD